MHVLGVRLDGRSVRLDGRSVRLDPTPAPTDGSHLYVDESPGVGTDGIILEMN